MELIHGPPGFEQYRCVVPTARMRDAICTMSPIAEQPEARRHTTRSRNFIGGGSSRSPSNHAYRRAKTAGHAFLEGLQVRPVGVCVQGVLIGPGFVVASVPAASRCPARSPRRQRRSRGTSCAASKGKRTCVPRRSPGFGDHAKQSRLAAIGVQARVDSRERAHRLQTDHRKSCGIIFFYKAAPSPDETPERSRPARRRCIEARQERRPRSAQSGRDRLHDSCSFPRAALVCIRVSDQQPLFQFRQRRRSLLLHFRFHHYAVHPREPVAQAG